MQIKSKFYILLSAVLLVLPNVSTANELLGVVDYRMQVPVISLVGGRVESVPTGVGKMVKAGDVLIELDPTRHKARVAIRQSRVDQMQIVVDSLGAEFERQQEMFDRGSLSLLDYEKSENALKTAQAKLTAAQARLSAAQHRLEQTRLVAPFDAIILQRHAHPGMNIVPELQTQPLMVLAPAGEYSVRLSVSPDAWQQMRSTAGSYRMSADGRSFSSSSEDSVFYTADSDGGFEYMIELPFRDESNSVYPGMAATVVPE